MYLMKKDYPGSGAISYYAAVDQLPNFEDYETGSRTYRCYNGKPLLSVWIRTLPIDFLLPCLGMAGVPGASPVPSAIASKLDGVLSSNRTKWSVYQHVPQNPIM